MVKCEKFIPKAIEEIKAAAGTDKVVMALSGGVDSSVCAALAARAIGDNLIPIYIDTGLMRKGETDRIRTIFGNIHLQIVDAGDEFLDALKGITDPEAKRMWKQAGRLSAIGLEMGFAVSIGVLGGGYLDDRFGTKPVLFWLGFAIGLGAAVKALVDGARAVRKTLEEDDAATSKKV